MHYLQRAVNNKWKVFPSVWAKNKSGQWTHQPLVKWSKQSSFDIAVIKAWRASYPEAYYCMACKQSDVTVLDIDNKKGKQGDQSLKRLVDKYGELPETLKVRTPSGGYHYVFKGFYKTTVGKIADGIDTPGMTPLPGINVPGKGEYKIISTKPIADIPDWLAQLIGAEQPHSSEVRESNIEWDKPSNIIEAIKYLQSSRARVSIDGEGGDNTLYQLCCVLKDKGISEASSLHLLIEFWNSRCVPEWSVEELASKIAGAHAYGTKQAGACTPDAIFDNLPVERKSIPISFAKQLEESPTPQKWLIGDGWIPAGNITVLFAKGAAGKSLIALQLALSVVCGTSWLNLPVATKMPVLVVSCEDDEAEMVRRLHRVKNSPEYAFSDPSKLDNAFVWSRVGENSFLAESSVFYKDLDKYLTSMPPGDKLVILDTLADLYLGNENDRAEVSKFVKVIIGGLMKKHNATVLLLGHTSKLTGSEYSGSTAWENAARTRLVLMPHDNPNLSDYRVLKRAKSNYSKAGASVTVKWEGGAYRAVEQNTIVDDKEAADLKILLTLAEKHVKIGTPIGTHHNSVVYLHTMDIEDANGMLMDKRTKKKLLNKLITTSRIKIVTGEARKNGIYPVKGD